MMLSAGDFRGLYAIIPTPATEEAKSIDAVDTVDLDAAAELIEKLVNDGVAGIIALGTTGECATLSETDYRVFVEHILACVDGRVQTIIGASALGGHQVADRMRFVQERGADGVLLGVPMWQPATTDMAVDFFAALSDAFPELAIMVYANKRAFRFDFPLEFWERVALNAPTVVAAKYSRPQDLVALLRTVSGQIHIMPNESTAVSFADAAPETTSSLWATAAAMGPAPARSLIQAILAGDSARIEAVQAEIREANAPVAPLFGDPTVFASYNIQLEKARINAAEYCRCGPCRPPYGQLPEEYLRAAQECGTRWRKLHERHAANPVAGTA